MASSRVSPSPIGTGIFFCFFRGTTCMGLRRLGSLSFRDNLTMAGVVQFHAKLFHIRGSLEVPSESLDLWCYVSWAFLTIYSEGSPRCVWGGHICQWTLKTMTWHLTPLHFSSCNCVISGDWAPASAIHPGPNRGDNNLRSKEATLYNTNYHSYSFIHRPALHRYSNYSTKKANIEKDPLL